MGKSPRVRRIAAKVRARLKNAKPLPPGDGGFLTARIAATVGQKKKTKK